MEKKTEEGLEIELIGFRTFFHEFLRVLYYVKSILLGLFALIVVFGVVLSFQESISIGNGIYFAFVSAFTVGYGDITPTTPVSKFLCALVLPLLGMTFSGIMVAAAMQAISRLYQAKGRKS
ncbi:Ion transport 2 domain protein [Thermococcus sp. 4557]|uniref:potassium channel family protein n=1 Tax=Thermococcus sp. (strain CGMCC 1.5172 / 4557) TaxID=1042877 RepID=UPI000219EB3A|nr:potassium channel family protein [Thermococcus sp. 4557]AEK72781.1 Ion transport 2 domain protein [Thermococcus sp. 4557]